MLLLPISRSLTISAVQQLAQIDYTIANRVTEDVSRVIAWSYANDFPWVASFSIHSLQWFDNVGSALISIVVWLVSHTP